MVSAPSSRFRASSGDSERRSGLRLGGGDHAVERVVVEHLPPDGLPERLAQQAVDMQDSLGG